MAGSDAVAKLTADVVVFSEVDGDFHVLLIKRGWAPFEGCWALPGGKVDAGETFEHAALRELAEETGIRLTVDQVRRVDVYDMPGRDPRGRYVSCAYVAQVDSGVTVKAGDDATDARWVPVATMIKALAFDHALIVADAVRLLGLVVRHCGDTFPYRLPASHGGCVGPVTAQPKA